MSKDKNVLPLFPLPEVVLFPGMSLPLHVFEDRYKEMISLCLKNDKKFGAVLLEDDLCAEIGTVAVINEVEKLEDGEMNLMVEGKHRFKILNLVSEEPYYVAEIQEYEDSQKTIDESIKKTLKQIKELSTKALALYDEVSEEELSKTLKLPDDPNELLFLVAGNLTCSYEEKQNLLESRSIKERAKKVLSLLKEEIERLNVLLENKETKKDVIKNGKLKI